MGDQQKLEQATADMRRNFAADSKTIERIELAANTAPSDADDSAKPGKSAAADTPAATNPPQDHSGAEVQSMVERLANRLKGGGGTAENWVMLVRSYRTLGDNAKAETAIADARRDLAASPPQLQQLEAALKQPAEAATKAPAQAQPAPR
jgi:cytochrome c-type biogenesis protein CcmH/NrfG